MTAIVILGAAVWADGPSPTLLRRTLHGAKLFHADAGHVIIPCGGNGIFPPSEAQAMKDVLMAEGVPEGAIHLEDQSTTTYENLRYARQILEQLTIEDIVIVTDAYHGPRALMVAKALRLSARIAAPPKQAIDRSLHLKRLRHEAIALPGYALGLIWWLLRDGR